MGHDHEREAWVLTSEVLSRHIVGEPDSHLEALSTEECLGYLHRGGVGRVAFAVGGVAVVLPVNFVMIGSHEIVFLSTSGSKLHAVQSGCIMTFEIDHFEDQDETGRGGSHRSGWSVLATGPARTTTNADLVAQVTQLGVRPASLSGVVYVVSIEARFVTGRRFGRSPRQARPLHRREP